MGCGESRIVPPSLPTRGEAPNSAEEKVNFEHHDTLEVTAGRKNRPSSDIKTLNSLGGESQPQDELDESSGVDFEGEFDFITENSADELVKKVILEFVPVDDVGLVIVGIPCSRLLSAVQRTKLEEEEILESLRSEGLISKSLKKSQNSTGFEIVEESSLHLKQTKFVPLSIREKEERPEKKVVTTETIAEKLAKAEERRKLQEEDKKTRAKTAKPTRISPSRLEEEKEELRNQQIEKWENGIRNRELQLLDLQEKLREKHLRVKGIHFKKTFKGFDPFDEENNGNGFDN